MEEICVANPEESPWWRMRLEFLMDNEPQRLFKMFKESREALLAHLDEMTARAVHLNLKMEETPQDIRQEIITELLCPSEEVNLDVEPLTEEQREQIWEWVENPESFPPTEGEDERLVTITI